MFPYVNNRLPVSLRIPLPNRTTSCKYYGKCVQLSPMALPLVSPRRSKSTPKSIVSMSSINPSCRLFSTSTSNDCSISRSSDEGSPLGEYMEGPAIAVKRRGTRETAGMQEGREARWYGRRKGRNVIIWDGKRQKRGKGAQGGQGGQGGQGY